MLTTMGLSQAGEIAVHIIFPSHFSTFREVVYFLKSGHRLIHNALDVAASPDQAPLLLAVCSLSEPVIFKCVPN